MTSAGPCASSNHVKCVQIYKKRNVSTGGGTVSVRSLKFVLFAFFIVFRLAKIHVGFKKLCRSSISILVQIAKLIQSLRALGIKKQNCIQTVGARISARGTAFHMVIPCIIVNKMFFMYGQILFGFVCCGIVWYSCVVYPCYYVYI